MADLEARESAVDEAARRAAADLRNTLRHASIPSHRRRRARVRPVVARAFIATAVTASVVLALVVVVRSDRDLSSVSAPPSLEWIVDLDGWPTLGGHVSEPDPALADQALIRSLTLATDAAPGGPIVVIDWSAIDDQTYVDPDLDRSLADKTSITIGGDPAVLARSWQGNRVLFVHVANQTDRQWVRLTSRRVTDDDLIQLSTRITIDAEHRLQFGSDPLPDSLIERPGWIMEAVDPAVAEFSYSRYGTDPVNASIDLSVRSAVTSVTARLGLDAGELEPVDIDGAHGFYVANVGGGGAPTASSTLTWKADGLEFILDGQGVDRNTLLDAARAVRPATTDEWRRAVATYGDPCDLLTADEVSAALHVTASPGRRVHAIGETDLNICSFTVTGPLGTVTVYLGHGEPRRTSSIDDGATESRDHVYVIVGAQFPTTGFSAGASELASKAIERVAG